jgi:hypothetical protein
MKQLFRLFLCFVALTAFIGGTMLIISPDGHSVHLSDKLLGGGPFRDFSIPGYILFFVVGGSNLAALISTLRNQYKAWKYSLTAGIIIIAWILVQILVIRVFYFLQIIYLAEGIFIIWFAFNERKKVLK